MAKNVNYTPEMTAVALEMYNPEATADERTEQVRAIAEKLGRGVQSVRQKLVREGVYVKPERVTKTGAPVMSKAAMVAEIAEAVGADAEDFDSLEKATKKVLEALREALK